MFYKQKQRVGKKAVDRFHRGVIQREVGIMMKNKEFVRVEDILKLIYERPWESRCHGRRPVERSESQDFSTLITFPIKD